ncbi:MAG: hypothetical protein M1839_007039 [Geoglossum umbratile]|nr:MAG: hypothetical protein M1839_007039 [Geoglossum umbratile]
MASTDSILAGKYPAKAHVERVAAYIKLKQPNVDGVIYLEGQKTRMIEDCDEPQPFRQRRNFFYLSGCELPDSYLTYATATRKLTLYIPPIIPDEVIWTGLPLSKEEALQKYDVDEVAYSTDVNTLLAHVTTNGEPSASTVWAIHGQVSDHITFLEFKEKDLVLLREAVEECRIVKDEYEVALIRKANEISTGAHHAVMRAVKQAKNECELEAIFLHHCISRGAPNQAYHSIVASGTNAATLHYQQNNAPLKDSQLLLLDAGCAYTAYASDITRTFPPTGTFTPPSLKIYNLVHTMQSHCISAIKPNSSWESVHLLAHQILIGGLLEIGILKGGGIEEIQKKRTSVAFFPHGLGHYLGLDTHDVGGKPDYADQDAMFKYLRIRGRIPVGSVVTVEPGIYFCHFIIDPYLADPEHAKYIDTHVLDQYWDVGGVRIEDNVLVTPDGYENLTTAVKDAEELGRVVNGV